jgi:hypothetical protein
MGGLAALALAGLAACATPQTPQQQREQYTDLYKAQKAHKALAYATFSNGGGTFGSALAMPDIESARQKALSNCHENVFKAGYSAPCRIIYENNEFVGR